MPMNSTTGRGTPPRTLITIVVVLVVLLVLAILLATLEKHDPTITGANSNDSSVNATTSATSNSPVAVAAPQEPSSITSRSGTITGIAGAAITFDSVVYSAQQKGYVVAQLTAQTTRTTRFSQLDRTQPLTPPVPGATQELPLTTITLGALRVGDTIDTFSDANIKDRTSFDVTEVRKTLLP